MLLFIAVSCKIFKTRSPQFVFDDFFLLIFLVGRSYWIRQ